ncbi:lantibiotic dehydratase [Streptomyces buecherae]|uniref:lantibiotic dehydratase n=1 Tax=Streptomyces buecherae TaxID=2763006 RepID=UPI00368DF5BA
MRRVFDPGRVAMARIPLRSLGDGAATDNVALLREGVFLSSRSAAQQEGTERGSATWRAYDVRSRSRTTPHGVFVGVATATLNASTPRLRLAGGHRAVTSPSPVWLLSVADEVLHAGPELLSALVLTAAPEARVRGDRLVIEHLDHAGARVTSVRATAVSRWLLHVTREGAAALTVIDGLLRRHPGASAGQARRAVVEMIDTGFLRTDVLPTGSGARPLRHLLDKLPPRSAARASLTRLEQLLTRSDALAPGAPERRALLEEARDGADALHLVDRPLRVDTLADADIALPPAVGERAAEAAGVLWRIGHRHGPLDAYHGRFRATYGHHRLVPVCDVLDAVAGLGPPGPDDALGAQEEPAPRRTAALARLMANALASGTGELALTEADIDELANASPLPPPRTAEIHIQLLRVAGDLRVAVCPGTGSQTAGAAPGRWVGHLPGLAHHEEADTGSGALIAEIVCSPPTGPAVTLAAETGTAPWRIPIGVPTRPGDLTLDELALTTNGTHLVLWSTRHDRPVTPVLHNRLAHQHLSPVASLLALLGQAGTRPWHPWSWHPFDRWPRTPRVRYRDITLAPARWRVPEALTAAAAHRSAFQARLATWSSRTRPTPPRVLIAEEADRRLPLDLHDGDQRELLRRSIRRGTRTLAEPFGSAEEQAVVEGEHGGRHLIELVVPLTRRHAPPHPTLDPRVTPRSAGGGHPPGSRWLYATLAAPAHVHDAILIALAPYLAAFALETDRWFWLRYSTPALGPHLRLRWHGAPQALSTRVQPRLATLADQLHHRGLLPATALRLETYEPETERYGGPQAISAAERLFSVDSRLALAALPREENERIVLAARTAADIARTLAPDRPRAALAPGRLTTAQRRRRDDLRRRLVEPAAPRHGADVAAVRVDHHAALTAYRDTLTPEIAARCASDVIHLHANRMLTTDPHHERLMRTLAADLLHRT